MDIGCTVGLLLNVAFGVLFHNQSSQKISSCIFRDLSVFEGHEVVEDGVDGGRDVVEDAGDVHQVLVNSPEDVVILRLKRTLQRNSLNMSR